MTKRFAITTMLLIASLSVGVAYARANDDPKIEGKWSGQIPRPSRSYDSVFEFRVNGEKLTGKVYAAEQEWDIVGGKVKGDTISFRIGNTQGDYTAKVSGDEMDGQVALSGGEFGSRKMTFKLTRVKD